LDLSTAILFALALNIDSFTAGTAYGMRNIKVPIISIVIISLISMLTITISMLAGKAVASLIISVIPAHKIGGILLICIGLWILYQALREIYGLSKNDTVKCKKEAECSSTCLEKPIIQLRISTFGLAIQVMKEPSKADLDQSGNISPTEAFLLGIALAIDALVAGFAVSMLGLPVPLITLTTGLGHFLLMTAGVFLGKIINGTGWGQKLSIIPGCILIALGISKIIKF